MRRVRETITAVEEQKVLHIFLCVCARALVALFIQHATRIRHTVICGLSGFTVHLKIIS
jgi:hypothetical protein